MRRNQLPTWLPDFVPLQWLQEFVGDRRVPSEKPDSEDLARQWEAIEWACSEEGPTIIRPETPGYWVGNSLVILTPQMLVRNTLMTPSEDGKHWVGLHELYIWGEEVDRPHNHNSAVVQMLMQGRGWMSWWPQGPDGPQERMPIQAGDIVVLPQGVWHHSNCEVGEHLLTVGVELGAGEFLQYAAQPTS